MFCVYADFPFGRRGSGKFEFHCLSRILNLPLVACLKPVIPRPPANSTSVGKDIVKVSLRALI